MNSEAAAQASKHDIDVYRLMILDNAQISGHRPSLIAAIISRETGASKRYMKNGVFLGDNDHGHGLMQVDDGARNNHHGPNFQACLDYRAGIKSEHEMMELACQILRDKIRECGDLRVAVAGYNCGSGAARRAIKLGYDVDFYTAEHNYSADVMARAAWFKINGYPDVIGGG